MITETQWLKLGMASETNLVHEFKYIGWCIKSRVIGRNRFPNTYRDVILQPKQFSYFNPWTGQDVLDDTELYNLALQGYAGKILKANEGILEYGARVIINSNWWDAPFGLDVTHYYSPISMVPKFKPPSWMKQAKYSFTPPGVDPQRFVFAAGVP